MADFGFEWDPDKSKQNQRKHGVTFEEAESVFSDDHGLFMSDPDHSEDEDRFILLGLSSALRSLVVCHCYREGADVVRIIIRAKGQSIGTPPVQPKVEEMRDSYDFSKAKPNPYAKRLKKQVTIRLDQRTIGYFKALADEMGVPYQTLINLYLRDCASKGKRLALHWKPAA